MNKLKKLFSSLFRKMDTANDPVAVDEPDLVQKAQRKKLAVIAIAGVLNLDGIKVFLQQMAAILASVQGFTP